MPPLTWTPARLMSRFGARDRVLNDQLGGFNGARTSVLEPLGEQQTEQHHALRVSAGEYRQLRERVPWIEPLAGESLGKFG